MSTPTTGQGVVPLTLRERDAVVTICLMAAMADGKTDDAERQRLRQIAAQLTGSPEAGDAVFRRVQIFGTTLQAEAAEIDHADLREQTYEMAVGLVNADGVVSESESEFLTALTTALQLDPAVAARVVNATDTLAAGSVEAEPALVPPRLPAHAAATSDPKAKAHAEADSTIQTYAILTAALELLPQTLASMAIIPLQTKMVYAVGKEFGYTLDTGHIKDLLATVGVGITSQVFEGYARRLVGGLLGRAAGGIFGGGSKTANRVGQTAAGAAVTFATTYALGKVAKQYYAGGRTLSAIDLQTLFSKESVQARQLFDQVAPQIQAQARSLNPASVLRLIRGGGA